MISPRARQINSPHIEARDAQHALEAGLGHQFGNATLLTQALTHRSFSAHHNERLEFLGDGVLNCAIATMIYARFPAMPEGELSRLRANLVNQNVLVEIASTLGVGAWLKLGEGEVKSGGAGRASILADTVEALLGAIYLDAGFIAASDVVEKLFSQRLGDPTTLVPQKDAKTNLQEWLQARRVAVPSYTVVRIEGADHRQTFVVRCQIPTHSISTEGRGMSRRAAEQAAATLALEALKATPLKAT